MLLNILAIFNQLVKNCFFQQNNIYILLYYKNIFFIFKGDVTQFSIIKL